MMVADASPIIVFARIKQLDIFKALFGVIYIPTSVYQETVVETALEQQRDSICSAIDTGIIIRRDSDLVYSFTRKLGNFTTQRNGDLFAGLTWRNSSCEGR